MESLARLRVSMFALIGFAVIPWGGGTVPVARSEERAAAPLDRTILPIPEPKYPPIKEIDVREATPPPRFEVKAPKDAPNIVLILIDDMGFGQSSAFGGPVHMPTAERLGASGLKYNRFHTTALCSPTRMALLTGRNHHSANAGSVMETATAFPGQTGMRPNDVAPVAEMLRLNGYSTAAFGKYHETAVWEVSPSGPTDRWPTRSGFDKFYGFIGGETNQWAPLIYDGLTKIEPPRSPDYHFTSDMTTQAVNWTRFQKALTPDKPFFVYFAPGATHAPHHSPKAWIEKYRGKFDHGWDRQREITLAEQKRLGVVPANCELAPKPAEIKDWEALTADEKRLFARQMEIFAGFGEHVDHEVGRLVDALEDMGVMENTLIFYILGDNGASAEGGMVGMFNEYTYFNGVKESVPEILKRIDDLGGPSAFNHYAAGWAVAGDTPFSWTKQVASNFGGTRNPMIVHWPKRVKARGEIRSQFHHVIDIAPTILEAAGLPEPKSVNGTVQRPIEGVSLLYSFNDASAKDRHVTQYFEIFANRAIYHEGWTAGTVHRAPWNTASVQKSLAEDRWELHHVDEDFSQSKDLAASRPEKLKEMQAVFLREALKYKVLPLDDRTLERLIASAVGRPDVMGNRTSLTLHEGMTGMMENVFINIKNRSHTITAEVETSKPGTEGVILAQGGRFGGWSLYVKGGKPTYVYNWVGLERFVVSSSESLPVGASVVRLNFVIDGRRPGSGGVATLSINGKVVGEARVDRTNAAMFSADETADVGRDEATPVTEDYKERENDFNGGIRKVTVELK